MTISAERLPIPDGIRAGYSKDKEVRWIAAYDLPADKWRVRWDTIANDNLHSHIFTISEIPWPKSKIVYDEDVYEWVRENTQEAIDILKERARISKG